MYAYFDDRVARMPAAPSQDVDLVRRIAAGEEAAFEELVERVHPTLVRLSRALCGQGAHAEEVVQETWVAAIDGIARFEGRSSLKTWLCRILTNRAKTRLARERRSVPFSAMDEAGLDPDSARFSARGFWADPPRTWDGPEGTLERKQLRAILAVAIEDLPASQRAVVTLRDVEGLSSEEVCNALEISETNQRVLLHRARVRLRAAIERAHTESSR